MIIVTTEGAELIDWRASDGVPMLIHRALGNQIHALVDSSSVLCTACLIDTIHYSFFCELGTIRLYLLGVG